MTLRVLGRRDDRTERDERVERVDRRRVVVDDADGRREDGGMGVAASLLPRQSVDVASMPRMDSKMAAVGSAASAPPKSMLSRGCSGELV